MNSVDKSQKKKKGKTRSFFGGRTKIVINNSKKEKEELTKKKEFILRSLKSDKRHTNSINIWEKTRKTIFNPKEILFQIKKNSEMALLKKQRKVIINQNFFTKNLNNKFFDKKNEDIVNKAVQIVNQRKLVNDNTKNGDQETLLEKIEKSKEIYLINMTSNIVKKEMERLENIDKLNKTNILL